MKKFTLEFLLCIIIGSLFLITFFPKILIMIWNWELDSFGDYLNFVISLSKNILNYK